MYDIPVQPIILPITTEDTQACLQEIAKLREDLASTDLLSQEIAKLREEIVELKNAKKNRTRRTKEQIERDEKEYSPYKSDGKLKPRKGDPIKSYDEFALMQKHFLNKGKIRDWALWTVGVSTGLRKSDLVKMKIGWVLNDDMTFKKYVDMYEKKTSKRNRVLITEAVENALTKYFDSRKWNFSLDEYVFKSQKGGMMTGEYAWQIISDAAKEVGLSTVINAHSMRHSFGCIAFCIGKSTFDPYRMESIRILLNHADIRTTAKYLDVLDDMKDADRIAVSDFVMGKSTVNELTLVNQKPH